MTNLAVNPLNVNQRGTPNQDEVTLPEFTFHHGHVEMVVDEYSDLEQYGKLPTNLPADLSHCILLLPTFEGIVGSQNLKEVVLAQPLLRGVSDSVARGDSVIFTRIGDIFFYLGPLNTTNNPNYCPDSYYDSSFGGNRKISVSSSDDSSGYNLDYKKVNIKRVLKDKNVFLDRPYNLGVGEVGSKVHTQSHYSNLTFEGRHGNSIEIGTRFINPYITIKNNTRAVSGTGIGLLSLGTINDYFPSYGSLSSDRRINEERETLIEGKYPGYQINFGNDEVSGNNLPRQDKFDYLYAATNKETPESQTEFDQLIIFSDRITFDARDNDLTMSAYRNINLGAGGNVTITNKGFSVIESQNIYLGKQSKTQDQPMVLGESLRVLLENLVKIVKNAHALVQGVPIPLVDAVGTPLKDVSGPTVDNAIKNLDSLLEELKARDVTRDNNGNITSYGIDGPRFFSHHHYIEQNDNKNIRS